MEPQPRHFTVEEANRTLPLVARIVQDIVDAYPAFQRQLRTFHQLAAGDDPAQKERVEALREEIDAAAGRINTYIEELQQIGCTFKGFEEGLVDFPSLHDGRTVLLCWKLGEESIAYWHEVDTGFSGRQPITPDMLGQDGDTLRHHAGGQQPPTDRER